MKTQLLFSFNKTVDFVAQGLLRDVERYYNQRILQGLQGPPGPPGPPGYSRLFGSSTNVTDVMEYIKGTFYNGYNVPKLFPTVRKEDKM